MTVENVYAVRYFLYYNQEFEMDKQSTSPDNSSFRSASLDPMLQLSGARKRKASRPSRRGKTNKQVISKGYQKNIITAPASNEVHATTSDNSHFVEHHPTLPINIRKDPLVSVKNRLLINACCKFSLNLPKLPVQLLKPYNITGQQDVGGAKSSGRGLGVTLVDSESSVVERRRLSRSSSLSFEVPLQNETDLEECDGDTVAETPLKSLPIVSNKTALAGLLPSKRNIMTDRKRSRQDTGIERSPKKTKSTKQRQTIKTKNNAAKNRITISNDSNTSDHAKKVDKSEPVIEKPRQKAASSQQKTTSSHQQCPPDKKKLKKGDNPNVTLTKDASPLSIEGSIDDNKPVKRLRRTRITMKQATSTRRRMSLRGRIRMYSPTGNNQTQALTRSVSLLSDDSEDFLNTKRRSKPSPKKHRYDTDASSDESLSLKVSLELRHPKATVMVKKCHPVSEVATHEQSSDEGMSWTLFQNKIKTVTTHQRSEKQSPIPPSSPPLSRSSKQRQVSTVHSSSVSTVQPLLKTERDNNQTNKPTSVKVKSNRSKKPPIGPKKKSERTIDQFIPETSPIHRSSPEPQDTIPLANGGRQNTRSKFLMTSSESDGNPQSLSNNSKEDTSKVVNIARISDKEIHQQDPAPLKTKSRKNKTKTTKPITSSGKQLNDLTTTTSVSSFTRTSTATSPTKQSSILPTNSLPSPIVKTSPLLSRKPTLSVTAIISSSKACNGSPSGSSRLAGAGSKTNKLPPPFNGPGKCSKNIDTLSYHLHTVHVYIIYHISTPSVLNTLILCIR